MQIHRSAEHGDIQGLLTELQSGVAVDCVEESSGMTPLMHAACSKHADVAVLELLIAHGADVNFINSKFTSTPFICSLRDVAKVRCLLNNGAIPFAGIYEQKSMPSSCPIEVASLLLELGFDPTLRSSSDSPSAMQCAASECDWERLKLFVRFQASLDCLKWTALMREIIFGNAKAVADQLKLGPDITLRDWRSRTAFLLSICSGEVEKAKLLFNSGGSLEDRAHCEESVLDCAILSGSSDMLKWILSTGVNVNMPGIVGRTPLMTAAESNNTAVAKMLLENGADLLQKDDCGIQAINFATNVEIIRLFVAAGADPNFVDGTGMFLLKAAVENGDVKVLSCLLELGANVNNHSFGFTALHQAANYDNLEMIRLLLAAGADPNAAEEDVGEWRPLWQVKSREAAQILIDGGASLTVEDGFRNTAFDFHRNAEFRNLLKGK